MDSDDWLSVFGLKQMSSESESDENNNIVPPDIASILNSSERTGDHPVPTGSNTSPEHPIVVSVPAESSTVCPEQDVQVETQEVVVTSETGTAVSLFECGICDRKFKLKSSLTRHLKVHSSNPSYACNICKKSYYTLSSYNQHMKGHTKSFACKFCGRQYRSSTGCKLHENQHEGIFKYCWKRFNYKSDLDAHFTTHSSEKTYQCDKCHARIKSRTNFARHTTACGKHKYVQCTVCGTGFKCRRYLATHMKCHQEPAERFQCSECGKLFNHQCSLYKHKKKTGHM